MKNEKYNYEDLGKDYSISKLRTEGNRDLKFRIGQFIDDTYTRDEKRYLMLWLFGDYQLEGENSSWEHLGMELDRQMRSIHNELMENFHGESFFGVIDSLLEYVTIEELIQKLGFNNFFKRIYYDTISIECDGKKHQYDIVLDPLSKQIHFYLWKRDYVLLSFSFDNLDSIKKALSHQKGEVCPLIKQYLQKRKVWRRRETIDIIEKVKEYPSQMKDIYNDRTKVLNKEYSSEEKETILLWVFGGNFDSIRQSSTEYFLYYLEENLSDHYTKYEKEYKKDYENSVELLEAIRFFLEKEEKGFKKIIECEGFLERLCVNELLNMECPKHNIISPHLYNIMHYVNPVTMSHEFQLYDGKKWNPFYIIPLELDDTKFQRAMKYGLCLTLALKKREKRLKEEFKKSLIELLEEWDSVYEKNIRKIEKGEREFINDFVDSLLHFKNYSFSTEVEEISIDIDNIYAVTEMPQKPSYYVQFYITFLNEKEKKRISFDIECSPPSLHLGIRGEDEWYWSIWDDLYLHKNKGDMDKGDIIVTSNAIQKCFEIIGDILIMKKKTTFKKYRDSLYKNEGEEEEKSLMATLKEFLKFAFEKAFSQKEEYLKPESCEHPERARREVDGVPLCHKCELEYFKRVGEEYIKNFIKSNITAIYREESFYNTEWSKGSPIRTTERFKANSITSPVFLCEVCKKRIEGSTDAVIEHIFEKNIWDIEKGTLKKKT
jgi:hypothetical protein